MSQVAEHLWQEYEAFAGRDLSEFLVAYLFVDRVAERLHAGLPREAVLCVWGITEDGRKVLLHLRRGRRRTLVLPGRNVAHVRLTTRTPMVFAVKTDAPWKDLKELSAWVKAHPDQLVWSSVGSAGPSRYTAFDWFSQIGVDPAKTKMVITEGAADSMTKLAGGHVVLAIHSVAEAKAMAEGGKIKLLAVLAPKRVSYISGVPTAEEQGVIQGVSVSWWAGISMPAATPDAVVKKWEGALAEMTAFVEKQAAYYTDMAGKIGIRK